MTRQRKYQIEHKEKGLCIKCSNKVCSRSKNLCDEHRIKANKLALNYREKKNEEELKVA